MASKYDSLTRRRICSALNCTNSPGRDLNISLFRFPKDKERCKQWIVNCRREDLMRKDHTCLYNNYRLCSAHFEDSQFYNPRVKNRLIWNSIPTIFMHSIPNFSRLDAVKSRQLRNLDQENINDKAKTDNESNYQYSSANVERAEYVNSGILEEKPFHVLGLPIKNATTIQFCPKENESQRVLIGQKDGAYFQTFLHSLPDNLTLRQSTLHTNFYGIWSQEDIPEGTRFGPYGGILTNYKKQEQVIKTNRRKLDEIPMNWLEYINYALSKEQQNLVAFQFQEQIFYISCMDIPANTELLAGYKYEHGCIRTSIENENKFKLTNTYHKLHGYDKCEKTFSLQRYLKFQNIQTDNILCKYVKRHKIFQVANRCHKCDECGKCFIQYTDFKRHRWVHIGVKPYKCDECGKKFTQNYYLKVHKRRLHTEEKPFKCNECGKRYADNSDLRRHRRLHTEENPYKCNECGKQFMQYNTLKNHKIRLHTGEKPYQCDECEKKFAENRDLKRHKVRLHNVEKPYQCFECGTKFTLNSDLKSHIKRIHAKERPFKCDACGKKFALKYYLNSHKWTHINEKPYECDECEKKFFKTSILKTHKLFHTGEKPYECEKCKKKFTRNSDLNRHKILHTGNKPYKCDECGKKFTQNYCLKVHKRRLHTEEKPFKCNECGKRYADNSDLRRHRRLHTEENPYKCNECGKQFVRYNTLQNHKIRLHTGEKPYQCDECEKKFAENKDLRRHKVRLHNVEKPYQCFECGTKFALNSDLKSHIKRIHAKERPFKM